MTIDISQFQAGEDVTDEFEPLKRRSGIVVSVRLNPTDADRLMAAAEDSGRTVSQVAREAIENYLDGRVRATVSDSNISMLTAEPMVLHTLVANTWVFTTGDVVNSIALPLRGAQSRSASRRTTSPRAPAHP